MRLSDIIIKDIKKILYDKKVLIVILLMPIVLMTILGFSLKNMFGSSNSGITNIKVAIVKNYNLPEETELVRNFLEGSMFTENIDQEDIEALEGNMEEYNPEKFFFKEFLGNESIKDFISYDIKTKEEAEELLNSKEISAIIVLPEDYIYNTYMNFIMPFRNKVSIDVIKHPDRNFTGGVVEEIVKSYSNILNSIIINKNVFISKASVYVETEEAFKGIASIMEQITNDLGNNTIEIKSFGVNGTKSVSSFQYYSAAIMAMFLFYAASTGGRFLLKEKEDKTFQRMSVSGIPVTKMVISNFFMVLLIALIQSLIMITYSSMVMNVYWGDISLILFTCALMGFAIGGIGVLVSTITLVVGNYKFANLFESIIIQFMALIGGSFVPVSILPDFLQNVSLISINGLGIRMYTNIMMGQGLTEIINYGIILFGMGLAFITAAGIIMRTRKGAV